MNNRAVRSSDYAQVEPPADDEDIYSTIPSSRCDYELERGRIKLQDILGVGQFGDVFRGTVSAKTGRGVQHVAVKTCKLDTEITMADVFLAEARRMEQLQHPHIIELIGVCSQPPVWIIMELAAHGELRSFLQENASVLTVSMLTEYCLQISKALKYLEFKNCVHRDVAARNILVTSVNCVKLADFGLSRWLHDQSFYTASKCKMPIKWMAPESINFRRFTHHSDVWMFGVCMWEIMTYGQKPFVGVDNNVVVEMLERGERLPHPSPRCPPNIYTLMRACWEYEPSARPTFYQIMTNLKEIVAELNGEPCRPKTQTLGREMRGERRINQAGWRGEDRIEGREGRWGEESTEGFYDHWDQQPLNSRQRTLSCDQLISDSHYYSSADMLNPANRAAPPKPCRSTHNLLCSSSTDLLDSAPYYSSANECSLPYYGDRGGWDGSNFAALSQRSLSSRLLQQKKESEKDKYWLLEQEQKMVGPVERACRPLATTTTTTTATTAAATSTVTKGQRNILQSTEKEEDERRQQQQEKLELQRQQQQQQQQQQPQAAVAAVSPPCVLAERSESLEEMELDRADDAVYDAMTRVLHGVINMARTVNDNKVIDYITSVKTIGLELKSLLANVDTLIPSLPVSTHEEIIMAHSILGSDMARLVHSVKLALQYSNTLLDGEYRKAMLTEANVLAVDSKHLIDAVDIARKRLIKQQQQQPEQRQEEQQQE